MRLFSSYFKCLGFVCCYWVFDLSLLSLLVGFVRVVFMGYYQGLFDEWIGWIEGKGALLSLVIALVKSWCVICVVDVKYCWCLIQLNVDGLCCGCCCCGRGHWLLSTINKARKLLQAWEHQAHTVMSLWDFQYHWIVV